MMGVGAKRESLSKIILSYSVSDEWLVGNVDDGKIKGGCISSLIICKAAPLHYFAGFELKLKNLISNL